MLASSIDNIYDPADTTQTHITAVRVVWLDPAKGTQTFNVSSLPNTLNTAADVENYFNTTVATVNGLPQSRLGQALGCYALTKVSAYQKGRWVTMQALFSDEAPPTASMF